MSEANKGRGRKGGSPQAGPGGSSPGAGRGGPGSRTGWIVSANLLAAVAVVLAVVALVFHFTEEDEGGSAPAVVQPTATAQQTPTQPTPTPPTVVEASVDDDPSIGPEDAPVVMIDFDDYQ